MVNTETLEDIFVIKINMKEVLLPDEFKIIYDLLWCRRLEDNECNLTKLIINLAVRTRLRKTFNESDNNDTILIYYKFNIVELPRFESKLLSVYNAKKDNREYKRLNKSKYFYILGVGKISKLSPAEQNFVLHRLEEYVNLKLPKRGELELLC